MATRNKESSEEKKENKEQEQQSNAQEQPKQEERPATPNYPAYLVAAARIPSSWPLGAPRTDNDIIDVSGVENTAFRDPVPGVMVLDYIPTLGSATHSGSPLNRAAEYLFNKIRAGISGTRPYQASDHMIYRVAIESMYDLYDYVKRIYRCLFEYKATNRYIPRMVLQAMGIDVDDWSRNMSNLYFWLLTHVKDLVGYPMVRLGNIGSRHSIYNSYFMRDGDIDTCQTYVLNQRAFWSYEEVDKVKGLSLRGFPKTFDAFREMWDIMRFAFVNSTDAAIIAADIRRVYAEEVTDQFVPPAAVDERVEYVKLDPVLQSIMNAAVFPFTTAEVEALPILSNFRITDNFGQLLCDPVIYSNALSGVPMYYASGWSYVTLDHINSVSAEPETADFVHMTRLKPHVDVEWNDTKQEGTWHFRSFGTEIVVGARVAHISGSTGELVLTPYSTALVLPDTLGVNLTNTDITDHVALFADLSVFDWHFPVVTTCSNTLAGAGFAPRMNTVSVFEDVQNYVPISRSNLDQIHEAVLLMEFGIDQ